MCGLSPAAASGGHFPPRRAGFSPRCPLPLWSTRSRRAGFSRCGTRAPGHRLSSCGTRAQLLHGMWDLPGPGLEPMSPALAGGLPTTAPPGKPCNLLLNDSAKKYLWRDKENTKMAKKCSQLADLDKGIQMFSTPFF